MVILINVNDMVARQFSNLPDVSQLSGKFKYVTLSGSVAGYISMLFMIVVINAACVCWYYKRSVCKNKLCVLYFFFCCGQK